MKPVLFLDVDGTLNLIPKRRGERPESEWTDLTLHDVGSDVLASTPAAPRGPFPMWFSRAMALRLSALDVELRWLTTWADEANTKLSPKLGFPTDLVVQAQPNWDDYYWKFHAVKAFVEFEQRPVIWIDDDAIDPDVRAVAKGWPVESLLIEVDPHEGIRHVEIDSIVQFLDSLKVA